jgi:predicted methyltransferase
MSRTLAAFACIAALGAAGAVAQSSTRAPKPSREIAAAVASKDRTPANVARDRHRHPAETLAFFGVRPTQTVVEFIPGGGWYTEILAPLTKGRGKYVALVPTSQAERAKTMLAGKAALFGPAEVATVDFATGVSTLAPNSADVILTFRNVHNLLMQDNAAVPANAFKAFYAALKPGGTLGVVDHRLPEEMDSAKEKSSGYIKRSTVVRLATEAGFRLAGESAVNANPKDTHDHPEGVWTLPPNLRLKDVDRAKYEAIGESDRFTLKFVKPA